MSEAFNEQSYDRLLKAAVELFAEKGFKGATVREICSRADTNAASVNYYFRNKERLYAEALAFALTKAEQRYPMTAARNRDLPPEQRLTHFIHMFLNRILDNSSLGHHGKLIAKEIANPTQALDGIVDNFMSPLFAVLTDIVSQLTPVELSKHLVQRCVLSILGQCLMYKHSRSVIDRICPDLIANAEEIERSAGHIAQFSLLAIRQLPR